eukprot:3375735-Amphidinium_carterae.2
MKSLVWGSASLRYVGLEISVIALVSDSLLALYSECCVMAVLSIAGMLNYPLEMCRQACPV